MREVVTKIYTFGELSEKAQKKVLDKFRDTNVEGFDWWDFAYEESQGTILERLGVDKAEIRFSGFWSQGDGASFTGRIDADWIVAFVKERAETYPLLAAALGADDPPVVIYSAEVERHHCGGHYVHEKTCHVVLDVRMGRDSEIDEKEIDGEVARLADALEEIRLDLSREIYSNLEKEHEYLTSDDAVKETIEANDYEFDEAGNFPPCAA